MWPNPRFPVDLITFTEKILYEKLHFLCSEMLWALKMFKTFMTLIEALLLIFLD